jgi:hypothetical protein
MLKSLHLQTFLFFVLTTHWFLSLEDTKEKLSDGERNTTTSGLIFTCLSSLASKAFIVAVILTVVNKPLVSHVKIGY